jgi:chromosome segregation ATPase
MNRSSSSWLIICLALLFATGSANAQTARPGGGANTQLLQQLQQLQQLGSERASLQAENAKMKKELEDIRKERDQLKKGQQLVEQRVKSSEAALSRSTQERASTDQELTQTKAKMQELIAKFRETLQTLRDLETQSTTYKQSLATRDQELKTCIDRNLALYHLNEEVLARLDKQGVLSRVAQAEPFTRIKRVQLENLIDEYKARAEDQRLSPASAQPSSAPPSGLTPTPAGSASPAPPSPQAETLGKPQQAPK